MLAGYPELSYLEHVSGMAGNWVEWSGCGKNNKEEIVEREWSGEQAESAAHSLLQPNISLTS